MITLTTPGLVFALIVVVLMLGGAILSFIPVRLWIEALAAGVPIGLRTLIGMRLRRVPPSTIVIARISAVKAGIDISINDLEAHYLAGGNVVRLVNALISADKAAIPLPFKRAAAIDLAGRDVLEAVKMSVIPKVIETPRIAAVAKDGIQLIAVSRVTVRTNLDRLVGGAGEETIIARVGEGMVSTIGSASTHKEVLEIARDPITVFISLVMPLVMLFLFGYAMSFDVENVPLYVVDHDKSASSRGLTDQFLNTPYFELAAAPDDERAAEEDLRGQTHRRLPALPASAPAERVEDPDVDDHRGPPAMHDLGLSR